MLVSGRVVVHMSRFFKTPVGITHPGPTTSPWQLFWSLLNILKLTSVSWKITGSSLAILGNSQMYGRYIDLLYKYPTHLYSNVKVNIWHTWSIWDGGHSSPWSCALQAVQLPILVAPSCHRWPSRQRLGALFCGPWWFDSFNSFRR